MPIQKWLDQILFTGDKEIKLDTKGIDSDTYTDFPKDDPSAHHFHSTTTVRQFISMHPSTQEGNRTIQGDVF